MAVVDWDGSTWDVAVLGAGAAGLVAATRAAERGARTVLLEKNRRAGAKILMSGGTRCNITNARGLRRLDAVSGPIDAAYRHEGGGSVRAMQQAFGAEGAFLAPALRRCDVDSVVRMFEEEGVATKIEANGKIFPVSDRAVDVLEALLRRLERSDARFRCLAPVYEVEPIREVPTGHEYEGESGFTIRLPDMVLRARRVIVTMGGRSYPGCGTTGEGYALARRFGHTIVEPRPALAPLRVAADWAAELKGLSLPDCVAAVHASTGALLQKRREALLFTHFGLSGPAVLDVSRAVARAAPDDRLALRLDCLPGLARDELDQALQSACRQGRRPVAALVPGGLPRRMVERLIALADVPEGRMGPDLARDERRRLLDAIKSLSLPVLGTLGFEKAEVTTGGVALDEVDPKTLESRLARGLHFAGEVLDLDGPVGGYNFQAAWSTGWLAGEAAAEGVAGT